MWNRVAWAAVITGWLSWWALAQSPLTTLGVGPGQVSGAAFGLTWISNNFDGVDGTNPRVFNGQNIGTADSTRQVILGITGTEGSPDFTSVTIQGITATQLGDVADGGGGGSIVRTGIYVASVPTGTTADISITTASGWRRTAISVWRLVGSTATFGTAATSTSLSAPSANLTITSGGGMVAFSGGRLTSTSATVSANMTLDDTNLNASLLAISAHDASHSGSQTYTITFNVANDDAAAVFVPIAP